MRMFMLGAAIGVIIMAAVIMYARSLRSEEMRPARFSETKQALRAHALSQRPPHTMRIHAHGGSDEGGC